MENFLTGVAGIFAMGPLVAMVGATILGVVIGALPGLNPVMAIALLLPLTYGMEPLVALAMVAGIYNGSMYGGAIPAILLRIPGTPGSIATTFDGFPMAEKGQASKALKIACWSSAIGGMVSAVALITMGPLLAQVTLAFGPAEYFWVAIFGMVSVGVMVGDDMTKGLLAAAFGLLIGTVGIDMLSGQARFTYGEPWLLSGFNLIVVLVGLYALPPVLELAERADLKGMTRAQLRLDSVSLGWKAFRDHGRTWIRSSIIGIGVGLLPGAGGNIASFLSYNAARSASKDPESFGKGNPDGVAAAECGNNADNAAAMIPALTLGIPGNVIAALVLGALLIQGIQPGPQLYHNNAGLVFGFAMEMFITSALLFFVGGMAATRIFAQVQRLPGVIMVPMILVLMSVGVYVINGRIVDLWIMFGFGLLGYALEKIKVPLAPIVLGLILGPLAEQSVRRSMLLARGDWTELFTRPISAGIAIATILIILYPAIKSFLKRRRATLSKT
jgi:putative tricarboxylic transport membrane protein